MVRWLFGLKYGRIENNYEIELLKLNYDGANIGEKSCGPCVKIANKNSSKVTQKILTSFDNVSNKFVSICGIQLLKGQKS